MNKNINIKMQDMIPILILARGGSKRIPNKNLVDLCGKPLIQYSIEESLKVSKNVFVSSDSDEILKVAMGLGAKIIKRPDYISTDYVTSEDAAIHFLKEINYDGVFILVQPTSPLIKAEYIEDGFSLYKESDFDSIVSVCFINGIFYIDEEKKDMKKKPIMKENGAFFITCSKKILSGEKFVNGNVGYYKMPIKYSIDIDTYEDLEIARYICDGEKINKDIK